MLWTIELIDDNDVSSIFVAECPLKCVKQLLTSAIRHDMHDIELFRECFELMERIQDDPQDEYQIEGGDMSERWRIVLKPASPSGWGKIETSVPCDQLGNGCTCEECTAQITEACGIIYDCSPVPDDHEFEDDCETVQSMRSEVENVAHATMLEYLAMGNDNTPTEWPREGYARDSHKYSWPNECWPIYRDYISAQCAEL